MPLPRRVLVCPQEFKGSMDALEAATSIARAVRAFLPDAEVIELPMADGGPGTAEIVGRANAGVVERVVVPDAYGAPVEAEYARFGPDQSTAVIDSAAAVSLAATSSERRHPLHSTSRGVGALIVEAARAGAERVILGVGGTASADGGAGAARALGLRLLDAAGSELPDAAVHLARLHRIEDRVPPELRDLQARIAVDVRNPLTGDDGATAVYGAQKGVLDWEAPGLDHAIAHWARVVSASLGREIDSVEGAGAGGGIPAGILAALPDATIESGAALVGEAIGLADSMRGVELVVTGEGSLDAQTAFGKSVAHVARLASEAGVPCLAVAGIVDARPEGVADAEPLVQPGEDAAAAIASPEAFVAGAVQRLLARWLGSPRVVIR